MLGHRVCVCVRQLFITTGKKGRRISQGLLGVIGTDSPETHCYS